MEFFPLLELPEEIQAISMASKHRRGR
ncbi:BnaAnng09730D [Brassica napus]|uniref:BnaAnng09730D protein n=1 Tax=Brassica napus TaxID=3708 RepID=A0A078IG87_BRANA|nr:BnaAnng09730D [Brassica napus]